MNSRDRFLKAAHLEKTDRPPIWLMRQAGRYLPEYRALKSKYDFITLVKTPELATEITLQPLKRFPLLDAAIIFSDILVIPEALGQPYNFRDGGGIQMEYRLTNKSQIEALQGSAIAEKLNYVSEALKLTKTTLGDNKALLGFCGSPWTLACYMIDGGSSPDFSLTSQFAERNTREFSLLMEKLSKAIIEYLNMQIDAGVDCVQIFDSWASICTPSNYYSQSLQWIQTIIENLKKPIPVILYAKGMNHCLQEQLKTGAKILSLDWTITLKDASKEIHQQCALQGNLDPKFLTTDPKTVKEEAEKILKMSESLKGYIFNLGHGMLPTAKVECVESLIETVTNYQYG